ncbi:MAG: hypothetical protein ACR2M4_12990 [Actinomycetota bacterium]
MDIDVIAEGISKGSNKKPRFSGFLTEDPIGYIRELESSGRFRRDTGWGRIYHPGKISFRETVPKNSLHILIDGDHVSAHIDRVSPLSFRENRSQYSLSRILLHNLTGMIDDIYHLVTKRLRNRHPEMEWD